jgi:LCP family protein required for cell wall assembly
MGRRAPAQDLRLETGIYRGRRNANHARTWRAGRSPTVASVLAFLWPGLGHAYAGHPYRALLWAVPPLALLAGATVWIAQAPEIFALRLLTPTIALAVVAAIALHAAWRVAAILDAWRATRSGPWRHDGSLVLVVALSAVVLLGHGIAGSYVQSVYVAGSQIFSTDTGGGANVVLDDFLDDGDADDADTDDGDADDADTDDFGDLDDWDNWEEWADWEPGDWEPGVNATDDGSLGGRAPGELPRSGPISVLIIGTDAAPSRDHSLTDSLMVVTYLREEDQVSMISFPRDTGRLPMYDGTVFGPRINTLLGRANRDPVRFPHGAMGTLVRQMEYLVGVPIHYWVITNMNGFRELVEVVGGVQVTLDRAIADGSKNLFLEPGKHFFTADEVMQVVRSRRGPGNSDWERARRQQKVLRAIGSRVKDPSVAVRMPEVLSAASRLVRTNVPPDQLADLFVLLEQSEHATTKHVVLRPSQYASRIPPGEVNGRYMTQLNMGAVRLLSIELFGEYSRHSR